MGLEVAELVVLVLVDLALGAKVETVVTGCYMDPCIHPKFSALHPSSIAHTQHRDDLLGKQ